MNKNAFRNKLESQFGFEYNVEGTNKYAFPSLRLEDQKINI